MSTLALTMIIRDEAARLPGFFAHHRGLWDDLVVVDTGSSDGSADLARDAGARLVETAWRDDFAAARNAGLGQVDADWILFLDADERIARDDQARLRAILSGSAPDRVHLQETINYCGNPTHLEWRPVAGRYPDEERGQTGYFLARRVGCFPGRLGLQFSGRVHESVLPAASERKLACMRLDVPVHHYGYVGPEQTNDDRRHRYRRLVELKFADTPNDPGALLEMATVRLEDDDVRAATELLERLVALPAGQRAVSRGCFLLGRLRREAGQDTVAAELLWSACEADPELLFCWLELVRLRASQEAWSAVFELLERAAGVFGADEPLLQRERLRALIKTGRLEEGRVLAGRLVNGCPGWADMCVLHEKLERMGGGA